VFATAPLRRDKFRVTAAFVFATAPLRRDKFRAAWSPRRSKTYGLMRQPPGYGPSKPLVHLAAVREPCYDPQSAVCIAMNEFCEVVNRCNSGSELSGALHWQPVGENCLESWDRWLGSCFRPCLLPHLSKVFFFAVQQQVREIIALDLALGQSLDRVVRERSVEAGQSLLLKAPPRGDRTVARLQLAIGSGAAAGHYPTLFACRAAAFAIPARLVFLSYCWQELSWSPAREQSPDDFLSAAAKTVNGFMAGSPCLFPQVHG
jgi:hypothetical protein